MMAEGAASIGRSKGTGKPIDLLAEVKDGSYSPEAVRAAELSDRYGVTFSVDDDGHYYTDATSAQVAAAAGQRNPNLETGTEKITFAGAYQYNQLTNNPEGKVINYFLDDPMYSNAWGDAPKATTFDVLWVGNAELGADRFISKSGEHGRTYLYEGGAVRYEDLKLSVIFAQPIAGQADPNFATWMQVRGQMQQNAIDARVAKQLAQVDFEAGIGLNIMFAPTLVMGPGGARAGYGVSRAALSTIVPRAAVVESGAIRAAEVFGPPSLATAPGKAYFWSGLGPGGAKTAAELARSKGGTTLETFLETRGIKMPVWDAANPASMKAWQDASRVYASSASGEVRAVIGNNLRPGNIWQTVELPALKANPNVTRVITVNPTTKAETVLWSR